jgi:hypothetical protein
LTPISDPNFSRDPNFTAAHRVGQESHLLEPAAHLP